MKAQSEAVCFSISKYWSMSCRDHMMEEATQKKSRNWLFACLSGVQSRPPQETRATMDVSDEERSSNGEGKAHASQGPAFDVSDEERSSNGEGEDGDVS